MSPADVSGTATDVAGVADVTAMDAVDVAAMDVVGVAAMDVVGVAATDVVGVTVVDTTVVENRLLGRVTTDDVANDGSDIKSTTHTQIQQTPATVA